MRPSVLIFGLANWPGIARLPRALVAAGLGVAAVCPRGSFLAATRFVDRPVTLAPGESRDAVAQALLRTMRERDAARVVPADDHAVRFLQDLAVHLSGQPDAPADHPVLRMLSSSLCDPARFATLRDKGAIHALAGSLGIAVPPQLPAATADEAARAAATLGYPAVVKSDRGSGGSGVFVVDDEPAVRQAFDRARAAAPGAAAHVQAFVPGVPAMHAFVADRGAVVASFSVVKERCHPPGTGPSSVVRLTRQPAMADAAARLARALGFNGFGSVDFVLDEATGAAHLMELNARPVPVSHLGGRFGADLCGAFAATLGVAPTTAADAPLTADDRVALFPQEWRRDPASPLLRGPSHDVPWDDEPLLRSYLENTAATRL